MSGIVKGGRVVRSDQARAASPKKPLVPIAAPPVLAPVTVVGSFVDGAKVVTRTKASLHLTTGKLGQPDDAEARKVLVAFAELRLGGASIGEEFQDEEREESGPDDPEMLFAATMPLENFAYVLLDLTNELGRICGEVIALRNSDLTVDPDRMAGLRYFVANLERQAKLCRVRIDKAYGVPKPRTEE